MNSKHMIHTGIYGFIVISLTLLATLPQASGVASQWLPSEGTTTNYDLSYGQFKLNGDYVETATFDVYNSSTTFYIWPSLLNHNQTPSPTITSLKNDTKVTFRHVYTSDTGTTWRRFRHVVIGGVQYYSEYIRIYNMNSTYYPFMPTDNNKTVEKLGFFDFTSLTDYVNCSARLGEISFNFYAVVQITSTEIISFVNYTYPTYYEYNTYTCSMDGKVKTLKRAYYNDAYATSGIHSTYVTFAAAGSTLFLDLTTDDLIMIGVAALAGLILGLVIGVAAGKRRK